MKSRYCQDEKTQSTLIQSMEFQIQSMLNNVIDEDKDSTKEGVILNKDSTEDYNTSHEGIFESEEEENLESNPAKIVQKFQDENDKLSKTNNDPNLLFQRTKYDKSQTTKCADDGLKDIRTDSSKKFQTQNINSKDKSRFEHLFSLDEENNKVCVPDYNEVLNDYSCSSSCSNSSKDMSSNSSEDFQYGNGQFTNKNYCDCNYEANKNLYVKNANMNIQNNNMKFTNDYFSLNSQINPNNSSLLNEPLFKTGQVNQFNQMNQINQMNQMNQVPQQIQNINSMNPNMNLMCPMMPLRTYHFKQTYLDKKVKKGTNSAQNSNTNTSMIGNNYVYISLFNPNCIQKFISNSCCNGPNVSNCQNPFPFAYNSMSNYNAGQINSFQKKPMNENNIFSDLEYILMKKGKIDMDVYNYFKGNFITLIKNQQSSRLCQFYFENTSSEVVALIFKEIKDQINKLLLDPYANYFVLKLFYYLNPLDRLMFIDSCQKNFDYLAVNKISTYPIQCIIEHISLPKEKELIIKGINSKNLLNLCFDTYGTHVIEKIFQNFEYDLIKPLIDVLVNNFLLLANNSNGLCVIKILIKLENKKEHFQKLKNIFRNNALVLIQNPYGNYALQTAIDNWDLNDIEEFITAFYGNLHAFSLQKFSSNVIERCIEKSRKFYEKFIDEILINDGALIESLLVNNFGNYVIQTALNNPHNYNQINLIKSIEKNIYKINDSKLVKKWRSIVFNSYIDNLKKNLINEPIPQC